MTQEISPELVDRMVALVRDMCVATPQSPVYDPASHLAGQWEKEAYAIASKLPVPVDPDLIEAREFLIAGKGDCISSAYAEFARNGAYDEDPDVESYLAAIKRGRELERGE